MPPANKNFQKQTTYVSFNISTANNFMQKIKKI